MIVEDEPVAARYLRSMLAQEPSLDIVKECENGLAAVQAIIELRPDIIFLDVQIPDLDGFGVLNEVRAAGIRLPVTIFVTAYDHYALQAFNVHAVDYLLKPYDRDRLMAALEKAKQIIERRELDELTTKVHSLLDEVRAAHKEYLQRFAVNITGRVIFVPTRDVVWIEATASRIALHTIKDTHVLSGTLQGWESKLDPKCFVRVNRSALVNVHQIREMHQWFHGEYKVILNDGTTVSLSRSYRDRVPTLLGELSSTPSSPPEIS